LQRDVKRIWIGSEEWFMASKRKGRFTPEGEFEDFVPAVFARSPAMAEEYRELLNDHDIPAILGTDEDEAEAQRPAEPGSPPGKRNREQAMKDFSRGVPILVPEEMLDEASEILADRDYAAHRPGEDENDADDDDAGDETDGLSPEPPRPPAGDGVEDEKSENAPGARPGRHSRDADPFEDDDDDVFVIEEKDEEETEPGAGLPDSEEDDEDEGDEQGEDEYMEEEES
jgi:hypothetical protein